MISTVPPAVMVARPPTAYDIASVAISGGIRASVTRRPLTTPMTTPTPTDSVMATVALTPMSVVSRAATSPASAYTAPTDRSTPPEMITSVLADATIRIVDC